MCDKTSRMHEEWSALMLNKYFQELKGIQENKFLLIVNFGFKTSTSITFTMLHILEGLNSRVKIFI